MLETFVPISKKLKEHIELFYVFKADKPDTFSHLAFPHINTAISFFNKATIQREGFHLSVNFNTKALPCIEILGKYTSPVFVDYKGDFEEIAIVFKPLGVNHFIEEDLYSVASNASQSYKNKDWNELAVTLFSNTENKIEALELFLLSKLKTSEVLQEMLKINHLFDPQLFDYSIEEIAEQSNLNLKTFQRHFTKHFACSPSEYKRIIRFRNSLNSKLLSKEFKSLTSLSYENNYCDQSHFIKEFKKLTYLNPKDFFNKIELIDDQTIIWEIK